MVTSNSSLKVYVDLLMPPSLNIMQVLHYQHVHTVNTTVSTICFIHEQYICSEACKIQLSAKHCLVARLARFIHDKDTAQFSYSLPHGHWESASSSNYTVDIFHNIHNVFSIVYVPALCYPSAANTPG